MSGGPAGTRRGLRLSPRIFPRLGGVARAVAVFSRPRAILLYSGRAHFYQRYRMRGASNYVFVSPPDHAHFYSELVSFARDDEATGAAPTALCLYTRFDALALARVLGDARARACLKRDARGVGGDRRGCSRVVLDALCGGLYSGASDAEPFRGKDGPANKGGRGRDARSARSGASGQRRPSSDQRDCRCRPTQSRRSAARLIRVAGPAMSPWSPPTSPGTPSRSNTGRARRGHKKTAHITVIGPR